LDFTRRIRAKFARTSSRLRASPPGDGRAGRKGRGSRREDKRGFSLERTVRPFGFSGAGRKDETGKNRRVGASSAMVERRWVTTRARRIEIAVLSCGERTIDFTVAEACSCSSLGSLLDDVCTCSTATRRVPWCAHRTRSDQTRDHKRGFLSSQRNASSHRIRHSISKREREPHRFSAVSLRRYSNTGKKLTGW